MCLYTLIIVYSLGVLKFFLDFYSRFAYTFWKTKTLQPREFTWFVQLFSDSIRISLVLGDLKKKKKLF